MALIFRDLDPKDYGKASRFAVVGMHFDRYTENKTELALYGKYFLYLELARATQVIAAYEDGKLAGLLLAAVEGAPAHGLSLWRRLYVRSVELVMKLGFRDGNARYDEANREMLARWQQENRADGELCFLAADPRAQGRGVGTLLLLELERREPGKTFYLFTDSNCTWQFYEHRDFARVGERRIVMEFHGVHVPLTCLLYAKAMAGCT